MSTVYGIDLGTTFSSCAALAEGDETPTLIVVDGLASTSTQLASEVFVAPVNGTPARAFVGQGAIEQSIGGGEGLHVVHPKRYVGYPADSRPAWFCSGVEYNPVEMSAVILRKIEAAIRARDASSTISVVVTHPRDYQMPKKQVVEDAVSLTGLTLLQTIDEPVAAALAFFRPGDYHNPGKYLVVDLGGGTLDIALLDVDEDKAPKVIGGYGDQQLGGKDWDDALYRLILESGQAAHPEFPYADGLSKQSHRQLKQLATEWKIKFSQQVRKQKEGRRFTSVMHTGSELITPLLVARSDWETQCTPLIDRVSEGITKALAVRSLADDDIELVLPVGGSIRLARVRELLEERFPGRVAPIDCQGGVRPDFAVAEGAARYAAHLKPANTTTPSVLQVATDAIETSLANAVSVLVADRQLAEVVGQGEALPTAKTRRFTVDSVGAQLVVAFYEGARTFAPLEEAPSATLAFRPDVGVVAGDAIVVEVSVGPSGRISAHVTHERTQATIQSELRVGEHAAAERTGASARDERIRKLSTLTIL